MLITGEMKWRDYTVLFLPKARGWDVREHLGRFEPTDIRFRRRRNGWRCSWDLVGTVAVQAYAAWKQSAPQRAALLTTGITPWGSVAGLTFSPEPGVLQRLAEVSQEKVQPFPVLPHHRPGVLMLSWHIGSRLDPPLAAALLSAQYSIVTGTLGLCRCGMLFVKPTRTRRLCDVCTAFFLGKLPHRKRAEWKLFEERLRGRMRYDSGYTREQYEQDLRQARRDLTALPFDDWRAQWGTRRGPQGRKPR